MKDYRLERDSIGEIRVPQNANWGAQTQRSLENFPIGDEKMPKEQIYALALIKECAAEVNCVAGRLDQVKCKWIREVAQEIQAGDFDADFPLVVWQTGSGTQSNMNVNEVISHIASERSGLKIHPNDDVNCSQSSNDTFPTAMHIAADKVLRELLLPSLESLIFQFETLAEREDGVMKLGRTHLQDAVPLKFSEEVSAWVELLRASYENISRDGSMLRELAIGGTAVGTGLNAPENFDVDICEVLSKKIGVTFRPSPNKFASLSAKHAISQTHASMSTLASHLMKIANDIRWMGSGPRSGLGELILPANEPGSSIMPGKVNPTQSEALTMVAVRVMGNQTCMLFAESQGNFELNVYMPLMIYTFLQSAKLLASAMESFALRCVKGLMANREEMQKKLENSLMLVTALSPHLGYDLASKIAKEAHKNKTSLLTEILREKIMSEEEYRRIMNEAFGI